MAKCPRCHSTYPAGRATCPRDGAALLQPGRVPLEAFDSGGSLEAYASEPGTTRRGSNFFTRGDLVHGDLNTRILDDSLDEDLESADLTVRGTGVEMAGAGGASPMQATVMGKSSRVGPRGADMPATRVSVIENMPEKVATGDEAVDRLGETLGSYKLKRIIGRGGMGCVYEAEHVKLGRPVALKVLNSDYARRRDAVARFFQEARAVNQIRHRNIVDITDLVETDDGTTFIIMELLDGANLTQLLCQGRLEIERAIALVVQICDALEAAHGKEIVHRDLKPDNVVVVRNHAGEEQVKLLDFGVAKLLNPDHAEGLTAAGAVVGTPAFMSPEQSAGLNVDRRSDIYSLGAIMYELFCEQPMFRGKSFGEYVQKHLEESPIEPRQTAGGDRIDDHLAAIIMRCLEKSPGARYQSAGELKAELMERLSAEEANRVSMLTGVSEPLLDTQARTVRDQTLPPGVDDLDDEETVVSPQLANAYLGEWSGQAPAAGGSQPAGLDTAMVFGDVPRHGPAPVRRGRWMWIGGVAALAAIAVISVVAAATSGTGGEARAKSGDAEETPAPAAVVTRPDVEPIASAPEAPDTRAVEVFSTPSGSLYSEGDDQMLCRATPCTIHVTLSEEGNAYARYVVRRTGYQDERFQLRLSDPPARVDLALKTAFAGDTDISQTADAGAVEGDDGDPIEDANAADDGETKEPTGETEGGDGAERRGESATGRKARARKGSARRRDGSRQGSARKGTNRGGSRKGSTRKTGDAEDDGNNSGSRKNVDKYGREIPGYNPFGR